MGIFNFFKNKKKEGNSQSDQTEDEKISVTQIAEHISTEMKKDPSLSERNFVDDLVNYFESSDSVIDAYFGYVTFQNSNKPNLFLSVGLRGNEDMVKNISWTMKSVYYPDAGMHFASSLSDLKIYEYIKSYNFPFFEKNKNLLLQQSIMKQWFEPEKFKVSFLEEIERGNLTALLKDFNGNSNVMNFQNYFRQGREFIPLFSEVDMIPKSGMKEIPMGITAVEIDFRTIKKFVTGNFKNTLFVLNPGTAFEVEFTM